MEQLTAVIAWILANYEALITAVVALMSGIIAVALLIPGEQPEKTLKKLVDFISKFSVKKSE